MKCFSTNFDDLSKLVETETETTKSKISAENTQFCTYTDVTSMKELDMQVINKNRINNAMKPFSFNFITNVFKKNNSNLKFVESA